MFWFLDFAFEIFRRYSLQPAVCIALDLAGFVTLVISLLETDSGGDRESAAFSFAFAFLFLPFDFYYLSLYRRLLLFG